MLSPNTLQALKDHAIEEYPKESCGLVIAVGNKEVYVRCRNISQDAKEQFRMSPEDYAAAEDMGTVLAIVHSHPDHSPEPSAADRLACEASGLPWVIISVRDHNCEGIQQFAPSGWKAPLIGRPFFHGVLDCYSLIKDTYERELGITLLEFEREDDWWKNGKDLYMEGFAKTGFRLISPEEVIKPYDVILMAIHASVANHSAVYLDTVKLAEAPTAHSVPNAMIHHLYGRVSERAVYGGYWAGATRGILRHKDYE